MCQKSEAASAIKYYSDVFNSSATPRDVQAMAFFNRALMYATIGKERQAIQDLNTVLSMPETIAKIKKSASEKLVECSGSWHGKNAHRDAQPNNHHGLKQDEKYTNR